MVQLSLPGASRLKGLKTDRLDDPVSVPTAASRLPASLISKLSLVSIDDPACDSVSTVIEPSPEARELIPSVAHCKRPLIQMLDAA